MSKKLTPEYVTMRTKVDRLEKLKNLNLWGCDLEDVSVIKQMPNLEVVSLSVNRIKTLKDFGNLRLLKELYLRKNFIADIGEIKFLEKCPNLKVLWLSENPIADTKNYRHIVIRSLSNLTKLDDNVITADERTRAEDGGDEQEDFNDYDNKYKNKNEEVTMPYEEVERKEEILYEPKKINNAKSPITNNVKENFGFKKSNTAYEDSIENDLKNNYNFEHKNRSNNFNQNYDNYGNNNSRNNDRVMSPKTKYNYDNYNNEESNMVDRFENLNVGGGNNASFGRKNDYSRKEAKNNTIDFYKNNDYRNDFRNDDKKSKIDEYNENFRDFNNTTRTRKSIDKYNENFRDLNETTRTRKSVDKYNENLRDFNETTRTKKSIDKSGRGRPNNNNIRSSNVLSCVLMLLKELNDNDLEIVRDEIEQKLGN
jgi:hypothetical protein